MTPAARRLAGAALLAATMLSRPAGAEPAVVNAAQITAFSRVTPAQTEFGALHFRGGLVLTSAVAGFGGFSGLRLAADGVGFTTVSDRANWLTGRLVYDGERLVGVEGAEFGPVLGGNGKPLDGTRNDDTEGLEISGDAAWLSIEGRPNVLRFDLSGGVLEARGRPLMPMPKTMKGMPSNGGLEAIALVPEGGPAAGQLLVATEEAFGPDGNHAAWLLPADGKGTAQPLAITLRDGFAVTDMTFVPGGDLVILERRYRPPFSLNMRVRRVAGAEVKAGAVLDGTVLMQASLAEDIDNMEGVSAHRAADGTTVLTLISDDNQSLLQRTVLLQFGMRD
jgi:hypothetical protein